MPVGLFEPENLLAVGGVQLATVSAGIKSGQPGDNQKPDLVLISVEANAECAAVFTRNAFCAAPVTVAKNHLTISQPRALLINSGNANAGTGSQGISDAMQCCETVADVVACDKAEVLPFSTGVIGQNLPMDIMTAGIKQLPAQLSADGWLQAAKGIMTTDTIAKACSRSIAIDGKSVTLTGIAKGSGMIRPDMATMLAFIATDARVDSDWLQACLSAAVHDSFNSITVDGDTSTNDACVLIATGASGCEALSDAHKEKDKFVSTLNDICQELAQAIVRDAEGASKFVTVRVDAASDIAEAREVAYTIAHSPLVKTALFASDPNWGRILAAVGRAGVAGLDIDTIKIYLDDVCIVSEGGRDADYTEEAGQQVMSQDEIMIRVVLNRGQDSATIWTSDLSHDYVTINSEYRT